MQYYKTIGENGFVAVSTINADGEGNSTQSEHDTLVEKYHNAPDGYGVVETESGFEYAPFPPEPEPEPTDTDKAEAYDILIGGAE